MNLRNSLRRLRRTTCEKLRVDCYSRPSLHAIDRKLERHLDWDGGFFIEAGANDGYAQSNTYSFEKLRGWSGLLIEPIPELARECRRNRRGLVLEVALVAAESPGATVELHFAGLMSTMTGALSSPEATAQHIGSGVDVQELAGTYAVHVPARTLSSLLDESGVTCPVDLLSLDVEGAEAAVLAGLDFTRHAPRFICVEVRDSHAIEAVLGQNYHLLEVLTDLGTHRDLLYKLR